MQLIASSTTSEGLIKLINEFYMSNNYIIQDGKAYNLVTKLSFGEVKLKGGRLKFYL